MKRSELTARTVGFFNTDFPTINARKPPDSISTHIRKNNTLLRRHDNNTIFAPHTHTRYYNSAHYNSRKIHGRGTFRYNLVSGRNSITGPSNEKAPFRGNNDLHI